jgi:hypothetical protein
MHGVFCLQQHNAIGYAFYIWEGRWDKKNEHPLSLIHFCNTEVALFLMATETFSSLLVRLLQERSRKWMPLMESSDVGIGPERLFRRGARLWGSPMRRDRWGGCHWSRRSWGWGQREAVTKPHGDFLRQRRPGRVESLKCGEVSQPRTRPPTHGSTLAVYDSW